MQFSIYKCIGKGYTNGWWTNCQCRYRAYKGARNSKKSVDIIGYEILHKIFVQPLRNVLVIRNTFSSHRQSTFALLQRLINQPVFDNYEISLSKFFKINRSEMTITYIPTGQMIIFKGMDDPQKIQSITVVHGYLTDIYIEEAFELDDYDEFRKVDGSIRGKLPEGYFHQITFLFNAWNGDHWLNEKFFKGRLDDDVEYLMTHDYQDYKDEEYIGDYGKGLYLHISTYKINEFRDKNTYDIAMERLKEIAFDIYKVEALGVWGLLADKTYDHFKEDLIIDIRQTITKRYDCYAVGIDFGMSNGEGRIKYSEQNAKRLGSANTMQLIGIANNFNELVSIDEYFDSNEGRDENHRKTSVQIQKEMIATLNNWVIKYNIPGVLCCYVDCADSGGFIDGLIWEAESQGLYNLRFISSSKIPILSRVYFENIMMAYGCYRVSENCKNLIREIKNARKTKDGRPREDYDDHAINGFEYAWIPLRKRLIRWRAFKDPLKSEGGTE